MDNTQDQVPYNPRYDLLTLLTIALMDDEHQDGTEAGWTVEKIVDVLDARTVGEFFLLAQALASVAAGFADALTDGDGGILLQAMALDDSPFDNDPEDAVD